MKELDRQPPKLRFKVETSRVMQLAAILCKPAEPFLYANADFRGLPEKDRALIVRGAVENVSCLGPSIACRQAGLFCNAAFCNALENIYGTEPFYRSTKMIKLLDQEVTLIKLAVSIFAFCTSHCTLFDTHDAQSYLIDKTNVLTIQNKYAEILWKYLLYRYQFDQAVILYTRLVSSMVLAMTNRTHLQAVQSHADVVDYITQQLEEQMLENQA
jgi:hypothetical protein